MKFKLFVVIFFGSLVLVTELLAGNVDRKIQIVFDPDSIKNERGAFQFYPQAA